MEISGPERDIIVVGASAGGVEALTELCSGLPGNLNAAVFIVLHTAPNAPGLLPVILQRYTDLNVLYPQNNQPIEHGNVYCAPPNRHLLVQPGAVQISSGPRENLLRPAADALFRSAAQAYGPRVVGVILSGTRNDGTIGLQIIKQVGGVAIVQDPQEAMFASMPDSALQNLDVDYVLKISEIAEKLVMLSGTKAEPQHAKRDPANEFPDLRKVLNGLRASSSTSSFKEPGKPPGAEGKKGRAPSDTNALDENEKKPRDRSNGSGANFESSRGSSASRKAAQTGEVNMSEQENPEETFTPDPLVRRNEERYETGGMPDGSTPLTCPECGGTLWEIKEGKLSLYVCHVGHRFSESSLLAGIAETLEEALWVAVRALEERAFFCRRLANRSEASGRKLSAEKFTEQADEASQKARLIRSIITSGMVMNSDQESEEGIS